MSIPKIKPTLLIVDDELAIVNSISRALEDECICLGAANAKAAKELFSTNVIACVLSDQRMPGESGAELLAWVRLNYPETIRILITGFSDFESMVLAVNKGQISHFLQKPWEPIHLEVVVNQALHMFSLTQENKQLQAKLEFRNEALERENIYLKKENIFAASDFKEIIGLSIPMQNLKDKIRALLPSHSNILVTGESGTGKELVARALHFSGPRKEKAFVAQNCAALPDSILESELFGHVKGAFTHAFDSRMGIIESADGGTLFLDEVGDMTLTMQAKLLRFLQEGVITQVGGRIEKRVDARIISATHRDLESMVREKLFREDLYYRLAVVPIRTPALREHLDDMPLLLEYFLRKKSQKLTKPIPIFSKEALEFISHYNFPGNVRELENAIEFAFNMVVSGNIIEPKDLPEKFLVQAKTSGDLSHSKMIGSNQFSHQHLEAAVRALEIECIQHALLTANGNISRAAKGLGLSRQGLHNKLEKYGIKTPS